MFLRFLYEFWRRKPAFLDQDLRQHHGYVDFLYSELYSSSVDLYITDASMRNEMMTFPLESRIIFKINPQKQNHPTGKGRERGFDYWSAVMQKKGVFSSCAAQALFVPLRRKMREI